jgi:hypothetical protein
MMYIGSVNKECSPGEVRTDGVEEGKKRKREDRRERNITVRACDHLRDVVHGGAGGGTAQRERDMAPCAVCADNLSAVVSGWRRKTNEYRELFEAPWPTHRQVENVLSVRRRDGRRALLARKSVLSRRETRGPNCRRK